MPTKIPFPTRPKKMPEFEQEQKHVPEETELESVELDPTELVEDTPVESELKEEVPEKSPEVETIPEASPEKEEKPSTINMENAVVIGGQPIEIKPTKLKYFRNKTAAAYGYIKSIPLTEFLSYDKGVFDKNKDADQLLFDWLVAVFDDSNFVTEHYDEITADEVEQLVKIFGRLNHINDKEEALRKNRQAQGNR